MNHLGVRHHIIDFGILQSGTFLTIVFVVSFFLSTPSHAQVLEIEYEGFTLYLDCARRGAVKFEYTAKKDTGSLHRKSSFTLDDKTDEVPKSCQQTSTGAYRHSEFTFDRGHLVPANHLDHLRIGIVQSNHMTNILPQAKTMNRGAWKLTEEIIECYRDKETLKVTGGVIWGRNPDDDFFLESHGVKTPDYFWKVVKGKNRVIAWLIPNSHGAKRSRLDDYLLSVEKLEEFIGETISVPERLKKHTQTESWSLPPGCDKS